MTDVKVPNIDDVMNAELKATGQDIVAGSYPATLFGFGAPFKLKDNFAKPGQPQEKVVFDARFGVMDQSGQIVELTKLLPVVDGGMANRKSNVYKMLKALAAGNPELMDTDGNIPKGVTLKRFIGQSGVLAVEQNKEGWPEVKGVNAKMAGLKYPTLEECKPLAEVPA